MIEEFWGSSPFLLIALELLLIKDAHNLRLGIVVVNLVNECVSSSALVIQSNL